MENKWCIALLILVILTCIGYAENIDQNYYHHSSTTNSFNDIDGSVVGYWEDNSGLKLTFYNNGNGIINGYMFGKYYQSVPLSYEIKPDNRIVLTYETNVRGSQTKTQVSKICIYKFLNDKFTGEIILQIYDLDKGVMQLKRT